MRHLNFSRICFFETFDLCFADDSHDSEKEPELCRKANRDSVLNRLVKSAIRRSGFTIGTRTSGHNSIRALFDRRRFSKCAKNRDELLSLFSRVTSIP